jgi:ribosomal protein L3 glutamine methyltransferase
MTFSRRPAHSIIAGMAKSVATRKTVRDWISWAENELNAGGVYCGHGTDNTLDEAAWLVGGALALSPIELEAQLGNAVTAAQQTTITALVQQRVATRKPAAYLLHEAWFAGLRFYVDERVIVPRSITGEYIAERFSPWIEASRVKRILDLCTGSGCMAIASARAFPDARVDAVDISADALAVARLNMERHALTDRVRLVQSDLFSALTSERYDVIVTNPPYVGQDEMRALPKEYLHEPALALESGSDGLDAVTRILADAAEHLNAHGILIAEVGNSNVALRSKFPRTPFLWLESATGDDSVFMLTAAQLAKHRRIAASNR